MKEILTSVLKMGSSTVVSNIFNIVTSKVIAVLMGPSGIGLLSILRNVVQVFTTISTVNGGNALVQAISSKQKDDKKDYKSLILSFYTMMVILVTICLIAFADPISNLFFESPSKADVLIIQLISIPIAINVFLGFFISVLNGHRAIGKIAIVQAVTSFISALTVYPLGIYIKSGNTSFWIVFITIPSFVSMMLSYLMVKDKGWDVPLTLDWLSLKSKKLFKHFFSISGTLIVTGLVTTVTLLYIRSAINQLIGSNELGFFSMSWSLSSIYLMLILSSFSTYYFPTLTILTDEKERIQLIYNVQYLTFLIMMPIIVLMILTKPMVISVLFSSEFKESLIMVRWMLLGDFLKVTSWTFGMLLLSNSNMKIFFWKEISINFIFLIFSYISITFFKTIEGIGMAYLLMYVVNLVFLLYYSIKKYNYIIKFKIFFSWLFSLMLIIIASWLTWKDDQINVHYILWGFILISIVSWCTLRSTHRYAILIFLKSKINRFIC